MKTYSLDLDFNQSSEKPYHKPYAHIIIKTHTCAEDKIRISSEALSYKELSSEVDRLIKELEIIRSAAKRKFQSQ